MQIRQSLTRDQGKELAQHAPFTVTTGTDTAPVSEVLPSADSFAKDLGVVTIAATLPQTLAAGVAGAIVLGSGDGGLFPVGIALSVVGAFAIWPIKAVR